jgi:hypothetical protein
MTDSELLLTELVDLHGDAEQLTFCDGQNKQRMSLNRMPPA